MLNPHLSNWRQTVQWYFPYSKCSLDQSWALSPHQHSLSLTHTHTTNLYITPLRLPFSFTVYSLSLSLSLSVCPTLHNSASSFSVLACMALLNVWEPSRIHSKYLLMLLFQTTFACQLYQDNHASGICCDRPVVVVVVAVSLAMTSVSYKSLF